MLCEDCGAKLIIITTSYGQLMYCPKCCDKTVELAFMSRGKAVKKIVMKEIIKKPYGYETKGADCPICGQPMREQEDETYFECHNSDCIVGSVQICDRNGDPICDEEVS